MTELHKTVASELLSACKAAVARSQLGEPAYCLVLAWSPGQATSFPPILGIGLESEQQSTLADTSESMRWLLWNPAEFENYDSAELDLCGDRLDAACEELNSAMDESSSWTAGTEILDWVAKELASHQWGSALAITEDFVAYATDYDLSDCTRSIRACASAARVADLEARGLLI